VAFVRKLTHLISPALLRSPGASGKQGAALVELVMYSWIEATKKKDVAHGSVENKQWRCQVNMQIHNCDCSPCLIDPSSCKPASRAELQIHPKMGYQIFKTI